MSTNAPSSLIGTSSRLDACAANTAFAPIAGSAWRRSSNTARSNIDGMTMPIAVNRSYDRRARTGARRRSMAATVSGRTSGTSTGVTRHRLRVAGRPPLRDRPVATTTVPAAHPGCSITRARGSSAGIARRDRVDVRAGNHRHARHSGRQEGADNASQNGFARLPKRQRGLGLTHARRGAGGEDDGSKSFRFLSKTAQFWITAELAGSVTNCYVFLDFPLLTCLHWPRFPRPPSWPPVVNGGFLRVSGHRRTGYADRDDRTAPNRQGLRIHS